MDLHPAFNDRMHVPDSSANAPLTTKQQREASRAAKVAKMKKQQANQKRNQLFAIIGSAVAGILVLTLIIVFVVSNPAPVKTPTSGKDPVSTGAPAEIEGLITFPGLSAVHVEGAVDYEAEYGMNPPAGGDHAQPWLTCGVYSEPQPNENAVHSLEHGAVWVTYDPEAVDAAGVSELLAQLPTTYSLLTPYPGLPSPVVASAWGAQVQLDGPNDPRLTPFLQTYWKSPAAPEPGAACSGAFTGPGKVG